MEENVVFFPAIRQKKRFYLPGEGTEAAPFALFFFEPAST